MKCLHKDTYFLPDPWPTGEAIEVCNCCGMSRAHWEQGESDWVDVDLVKDRKSLCVCLDNMEKKTWRHHEEITEHLIIRCDRLEKRLGRLPSFLPVGRQEVKDLAQWNIESQKMQFARGGIDCHEWVIASFTGILPAVNTGTVHTLCSVRLKQI